MKYVSVDINGWLNGTVCRFLTKSEKAIWGDFIMLGGEGEGRFGYIEEFKGVPYTKTQLLAKTHCFTPEDIAAFDSCYTKCLDGVLVDSNEIDKARITLDENDCIRIENWNTYQHSDYPQGYTEDECRKMKKAGRESKVADKIPIEQEVGVNFAAAKLAKQAYELMAQANKLNPDIAERTVFQCQAEEVHDKGGNYLEGTKVKTCKCNVCGKRFRLPIEKDESVDVVNGLIINRTCRACRNDESIKSIQPKSGDTGDSGKIRNGE